MNNLKDIKLKIRDAKNKITGKQKVIDEYQNLTQEIAVSSDAEKDLDKKKVIIKLYQEVTDEKMVDESDYGFTIESHNPYKEKKKDTKKKIEIGTQGLAKIRDGR